MLPAIVLAGAVAALAPAPDAYERLDRMVRAMAEVRSYTMTLAREEWVGDGMTPEETIEVRWTRGGRHFLRVLSGPEKGREVVYVPGENGDRLNVRLATWPHFRVNLDPCGKLALQGFHRPIAQSTLPYLVDAVRENVARGRERRENRGEVGGEEVVDGRRTVVVDFSGPTKTRAPYTVGPGETLDSIGRKLGISVRTLLHANRSRGLDACDAVRAGDTIEAPRYDASRVRLWIDLATDLPLRVELWDDDGMLFERFEHRGLKLGEAAS